MYVLEHDNKDGLHRVLVSQKLCGISSVTYHGMSTDENAFPGFCFVQDTRLQASLQEVFIPRSMIDLGDLVKNGQCCCTHVDGSIVCGFY